MNLYKLNAQKSVWADWFFNKFLRLKKLCWYLIISSLFGTVFCPFNNIVFGGTSCQECRRTAILKEATGFGDRNIGIHLVEYMTTPCFHYTNKAYMDKLREIARKQGWEMSLAPSAWKPPEYYATALFERAMKGPVVSRWTIALFHESGELVRQWITQSDRPDKEDTTFGLHRQRMFRNDDAVYKTSPPVSEIIKDFEKKPHSCSVHTDKNRVLPGEEIPVVITDFTDKEGRKSREFNRIIVYAVEGEIIGGEGLSADTRLKAFQLEEGAINLTYKAPEACDESSDTIFIHNSCDILSPKINPLNRTGLEDKIAEKKMNIDCSDATATIKARFRSNYHHHKVSGGNTYDDKIRTSFDVTVEASFKYHKTRSKKGGSQYSEKYKLTSWEITESTAKLKGKSIAVLKDRTHTTETDAAGTADKGGDTNTLSILYDAKTRKALEVEFPAFSVNINGKAKIKDSSAGTSEEVWRYYYRPIWAPFKEFIKVNSGDGQTNIGGKGTHVFEKTKESIQSLSVDWNIKLKEKK